MHVTPSHDLMIVYREETKRSELVLDTVPDSSYILLERCIWNGS